MLGGDSVARRPNLVAQLAARVRRPDWPLAVVLVGYPIWWVLGITQVVIFACVALMLLRLVGRRRLLVPAGFGWWLLFLAWAVVGVLVVQADAPGVLLGHNGNRYLTCALRIVWYLEATVVLLYVANVRREFSVERVARILSAFFLAIVAGGLLGVLAPSINLHSLVEILAPARFTSNPFVSSLVHPTFAERQVYLDSVQYRPSAPFPYANEWGLNYACFLPLFAHSWYGRGGRTRKLVALLILGVSVVPVVYSLNRGLWAVVLLMAAATVVKQAVSGRFRPLAVRALGCVLVVVLIAVSPLGTQLAGRFSGHNSNEGRTNLSAMSVAAVAQSSPIIGLGTTRPVQGSFYSIAGGSTPSCPTCTPPAFGTQGFLWLLIFGQGFLGAAFCLMFFVTNIWRHRRRRSPLAFACQIVLMSFLVTLPIYDWSITTSFAVMASVAILGRLATVQEGGPLGRLAEGGLAPARALAEPRTAIVLCTIGALAACVWQFERGPTYLGTASIWLPASPHSNGAIDTMDSEARYLNSPPVLKSISAMQELDKASRRGRLAVTATANTRILNISYSSGDPMRAQAGASVAAAAMLTLRDEREKSDAAASSTLLDASVIGVTAAEETLDHAISTLGASGGAGVPGTMARLRYQRHELGQSALDLDEVVQDALVSGAPSGQMIGPVTVRQEPQRWNVAIGSGLMLGLLVASAVTLIRQRRGRKVGSVDGSSIGSGLNLPIDAMTEATDVKAALIARRWQPFRAVGYVSVDPDDSELCAASGMLDQAHRQLVRWRVRDERKVVEPEAVNDTARGVVLVAPGTIRAGEVDKQRVRLAAAGVDVVGLLVWRRQ